MRLKLVLTLLGWVLATGCIEQVDQLWFQPDPLTAYSWPANEVPESRIEEVELQGSALAEEQAPTLFGVWLHPCEDSSPQDCPPNDEYDRANRETTVLYLHGGRGNLESHWARLQILWRMGFAIFAVDYRGYGRSTGSPSEAGLYLDARSALNHVLEQLAAAGAEQLPRPELSRVIYYGHSLGGAVAIDLASEFNPSLLITESSIVSAQALVDDALGLGLPAGTLMSSEFDAIAKIPFVTAPKLVLHGTEDILVRFEFAQLLYQAASEPRKLVAIAGADHNNLPCPSQAAPTPGADSSCIASPSYLAELNSFIEEFLAP